MKIQHLLIISLLITSCSKYPIVFSRNNEILNYDLTLNEDNSFEAFAKNINDTNSFHETGLYSIKDSILILNYALDKRVKGDNIYILTNDTFLILKYNDTYLLYPFIKSQLNPPSKTKYMKMVINDYVNEDFEKRIGVYFLQVTEGDFEQIYTSKSLISPYFDRYIKQ